MIAPAPSTDTTPMTANLVLMFIDFKVNKCIGYRYENTRPSPGRQGEAAQLNKREGEMINGASQLPASHSKKTGTFNLPTVMVGSIDTERFNNSFRPKY
jgi:hypothetical protein